MRLQLFAALAVALLESVRTELLKCEERHNFELLLVTNGTHYFSLDDETKKYVEAACYCRWPLEGRLNDYSYGFFVTSIVVEEEIVDVLVGCSERHIPGWEEVLLEEYILHMPFLLTGIQLRDGFSNVLDDAEVPMVDYKNRKSALRLLVFAEMGVKKYVRPLFLRTMNDISHNVDLDLKQFVQPEADSKYLCVAGVSKETADFCHIQTRTHANHLDYAVLCCCQSEVNFCSDVYKHASADLRECAVLQELSEMQQMTATAYQQTAINTACSLRLILNRTVEMGVTWVRLRFDLGARSAYNVLAQNNVDYCPRDQCRTDHTQFCSAIETAEAWVPESESVTCCCYKDLCNVQLLEDRIFFHFDYHNHLARVHCHHNTLLMPYLYKTELCNGYFDPFLNRAVNVEIYYQIAAFAPTYLTRDHVNPRAGAFAVENCDTVVAVIQFADAEDCQNGNYGTQDVGSFRLFLRCSCINEENVGQMCDTLLTAKMPLMWARFKEMYLRDETKYPPCEERSYRSTLFRHLETVREDWNSLRSNGPVYSQSESWRGFVCRYEVIVGEYGFEIRAFSIPFNETTSYSECVMGARMEGVTEEGYWCCHHRFYDDQHRRRCSLQDALDFLKPHIQDVEDRYDLAAPPLMCGSETCPFGSGLGCFFHRRIADTQHDGFRGGCMSSVVSHVARNPEGNETGPLMTLAPCTMAAFDGRCFTDANAGSKEHAIICCCRSPSRCAEIISHYHKPAYGTEISTFSTTFN